MSGFNQPPYYITAYGLAVKQGFVGTLDEWLLSLHGDDIELRYLGEKLQWRRSKRMADLGPEEGWQDLFDMEGTREAIFSKAQGEVSKAEAAAGRAEAAAAKIEVDQEYIETQVFAAGGSADAAATAARDAAESEQNAKADADRAEGAAERAEDAEKRIEKVVVEAVSYNPQALPPEQQAQARENIGVEDAVLAMLVDLGIAPVLLDADGTVLCDTDDAILINT